MQPATVTLLPSFVSAAGVHVSFSLMRTVDAAVALIVQKPQTGTSFTWKLVINQDATLGVITATASYSSQSVKVLADMKWHRVDLVWGLVPTLSVDGASASGPATMPYPGAGGALDVGFGAIGNTVFRVDELYLFSQ
jgi:hypothetical protein